jgi:HSP20 family molecular chaperone IbpA
MSKDDEDGSGFSKITNGLAGLINLLVDLEKNGDLPRQGRREKNGVVVEYSVGGKTADGSPPEPAARQTARARPAARGAKRTAIELLEPVTDEFDEPDDLVFLFELPGVSRADVRCLLDGDILLLEAKAEGRLYRKEILIEAPLTGESPRLRLSNGVLEVRLKKKV